MVGLKLAWSGLIKVSVETQTHNRYTTTPSSRYCQRPPSVLVLQHPASCILRLIYCPTTTTPPADCGSRREGDHMTTPSSSPPSPPPNRREATGDSLKNKSFCERRRGGSHRPIRTLRHPVNSVYKQTEDTPTAHTPPPLRRPPQR